MEQYKQIITVNSECVAIRWRSEAHQIPIAAVASDLGYD